MYLKQVTDANPLTRQIQFRHESLVVFSQLLKALIMRIAHTAHGIAAGNEEPGIRVSVSPQDIRDACRLLGVAQCLETDELAQSFIHRVSAGRQKDLHSCFLDED